MEIFEKIKKIVCESYDINENEITENTRIVEDLHADSLDLVELATTIEDVFEVTIPDEKMENMSTLEDVVNFITLAKSKDTFQSAEAE